MTFVSPFHPNFFQVRLILGTYFTCRILFFSLRISSLCNKEKSDQSQMHNLQGSVQNENAEPLVQKAGKISTIKDTEI